MGEQEGSLCTAGLGALTSPKFPEELYLTKLPSFLPFQRSVPLPEMSGFLRKLSLGLARLPARPARLPTRLPLPSSAQAQTIDAASARLLAPLTRFCSSLTDKTAEREIYNGILSTQIKLVKGFSLLTSCVGLGCQPILLTQVANSGGQAVTAVAVGAFFSFFTFATPLLIHSVAKKYVTKLYYNQVEDKYTAVVYNLFVRPKKIEFKLSDVEIPHTPGMFVTFKANNVPLFVESSQFSDLRHYGKLMGYDKPLDLLWDRELDMTKAMADRKRKESSS